MHLVIAVDGNNKIGMGHVYRMINLTKILRKRGHIVTFITKELKSKNFISKTNSCEFITPTSLNKIKIFLEEFRPDVILIDKFNETKKILQILKKSAPIIAIDYTGKNKDMIDFGINILYHDTGIQKNSISNFNNAILDPQFLKYKKKKLSKNIREVLVLQGGADTHCFIPKIIKALSSLEFDININVVVGPAFQCWKQLQLSKSKSRKNVEIFHNVSNMPKLMKKSDLAISAGGNTLLELAYLGIPSLVICAEKFEEETANQMMKNGFGINAGFGKQLSIKQIQSHVVSILHNTKLQKNMNIIGPKLVDGKGISRISGMLESIHN